MQCAELSCLPYSLALPPSCLSTPCSNVQRILADWDALLPATLAAWGEGDERLAAAFESHRSALMSGAAQRWQELNPLVCGCSRGCGGRLSGAVPPVSGHTLSAWACHQVLLASLHSPPALPAAQYDGVGEALRESPYPFYIARSGSPAGSQCSDVRVPGR